VGLLALALTPVIVSGGIDLSVGSLLGFSAVVLGELWRDAGVPLAAAVPLTLALGAAAGALNALLVARLRMPPLIVTLGTFSLFRGLAEGLTAGVENYTGFPDTFLRLGQGHLLGAVPVQAVVLVAAAAGYGVLLHASVAGRALYAIGFSPEGARHAGLPVGRRLALVYVLAGVMAALAGLVYVAYLGQAKADAGTGYELTAITAVVLGGTSIFGGRGTVQGTLLGVAALAVLHNGLRLADLPTEMAGVLTGLLLVAAILARRWLAGERTTT
jgi:rhamnose transport system permease protein